MHRAGDDELRRRHVHGEEYTPFRRLLDAALARTDVLFQHRFQRIAADLAGLHQPLRPAVLVGDDDDAAPRRAFFVQGIEDVEFHVRSREWRIANGAWRMEGSTIRYSLFAIRPLSTPPS